MYSALTAASFPVAQEVNKALSLFLVLGIFHDDDTVHPYVAAFLGDDVIQIGIFFNGCRGRAGIVYRDGAAAADHRVLDVVCSIGQNHRFLINQKLAGFCELRRVGGVDVISETGSAPRRESRGWSCTS